MAWILCGVLYGVIALILTGIARVADDPYGHFSPGRDWMQAIVIGVFWPFWLVYILGTVLWFYIRGR